jgi:hypothetical protein
MRHRLTRTAPIAAAFGLAAALAGAPALAYEEGGAYQQPSEPTQPVQVSEAKIDQFVDALTEISVIRETAAAELDTTTDTAEAQQIQMRAQEEMIQAVENAGLSVEEYNQIAALMGSDPELQQEIHSRLEERS